MKRGYSGNDVLKKLRVLQGEMSQRHLAVIIGVSQQYLNDVFRGVRKPGKAILDYLDLEQGFIDKSQRAA